MTPEQMYRAMRKWEISLVFDPDNEMWWAGDAKLGSTYGLGSVFFPRLEVKHAGSQHRGVNPEIAVEDYCNARNLEWDA